MIEPFYQDEAGITIYCGRAEDVLPTLATGSADLIVTDPPYGQRYSTDRRKEQARAETAIANDRDGTLFTETLPEIVRALKDRRHLYAFGRWAFDGLPMTSSVELIWDKGSWTAGDLSLPWSPQHEVISFAVKRARAPKGMHTTDGVLAARLRRGSILRYPRPSRADHPMAKPVALLRELIEASSRFGELVLDPFMGDGPTLAAARLEGRRAIGIEINEHYCTLAVLRLQQIALPFEVSA